jgi:protein phosphatase
MGTTITAAYVGEDAVVVAHVGDSRCYLLRDGTLTRLTRDHSLVGELVARGKLTEEQAEAHPQRSVITRALGPEAHVDVDVDVFPAREGDTFLLCSDGLTSMVPEARVTEILTAGPTLTVAGRGLIDAANAAGGRDNITVILFRLEDVGDVAGRHDGADQRTQEHALPDPETAEHPSRVAVAVHDDDQPTAMVPRIEPPDPPHVDASRGGDGGRRKRRRFGLHPGFVLLMVGIVLPLLIGGWLATRSVFFLGTDVRDGRTVAIYRGLPYDLPFGIQLYSRYAGSGVTIDQVPARRRATFTDHKLRSRDDAEDLVIALEKGRLE